MASCCVNVAYREVGCACVKLKNISVAGLQKTTSSGILLFLASNRLGRTYRAQSNRNLCFLATLFRWTLPYLLQRPPETSMTILFPYTLCKVLGDVVLTPEVIKFRQNFDRDEQQNQSTSNLVKRGVPFPRSLGVSKTHKTGTYKCPWIFWMIHHERPCFVIPRVRAVGRISENERETQWAWATASTAAADRFQLMTLK